MSYFFLALFGFISAYLIVSWSSNREPKANTKKQEKHTIKRMPKSILDEEKEREKDRKKVKLKNVNFIREKCLETLKGLGFTSFELNSNSIKSTGPDILFNILDDTFKAKIEHEVKIFSSVPHYINEMFEDQYDAYYEECKLIHEFKLVLDKPLLEKYFPKGYKDIPSFYFGSIYIDNNSIIFSHFSHHYDLKQQILNLNNSVNSVIDLISDFIPKVKKNIKWKIEFQDDIKLIKNLLIDFEDSCISHKYLTTDSSLHVYFEFEDKISNVDNHWILSDKTNQIFEMISSLNSSLHILGSDYKVSLNLKENKVLLDFVCNSDYTKIESGDKFYNRMLEHESELLTWEMQSQRYFYRRKMYY